MAKCKYTQDASGYFQTKVWDGTYDEFGRKNRKTLRSKKSSRDLELKVEQFRRSVEERKILKNTDITFFEYAREWKNVYKATKSRGTQLMYDNIVEKHLFVLEGLKLKDIGRIHYQLVINNADGKTRTQQQIKLTFKQILRSAVADQYVPANVVEDIFKNVDPIRYTPDEKRPLKDYERDALFSADLSTQDKVFVYILYGCGLRRGEALALTRFNVDVRQRILTVQRSIAFDSNNPYEKDTKSKNGVRSVPIPDKIFPVVKSYVEGLQREKLFCMASGGWLTKSSYDKMWARIIREMNRVSKQRIHGLTAHIFRHNYCTNLCYQIPMISIEKIAELLGDTQKMVLEVYDHMILEKEDAAGAVAKALNF